MKITFLLIVIVFLLRSDGEIIANDEIPSIRFRRSEVVPATGFWKGFIVHKDEIVGENQLTFGTKAGHRQHYMLADGKGRFPGDTGSPEWIAVKDRIVCYNLFYSIDETQYHRIESYMYCYPTFYKKRPHRD